MKSMMKSVAIWLFAVAAQLPFLWAFPSTAPAFLWSPHYHQISEAVNYQTISSKDLAKSILSEGGWSNLLCSKKKYQPSVDLALVFVGRELLSSDISANRNADPALLNLLKVSFMSSNFSMAFPYVAVTEDNTMESLLFSGFAETCGQNLVISNLAFSESCSLEGENFQKLADLHAVHDHLVSRTENRPNGQAELVVFCHGGSSLMKGLDQPKSESEIFFELISSVERLGTKYAVLYVSDPYRSTQYRSHREIERFLAEDNTRSRSSASICDEVCQIKSSLLEGVLVRWLACEPSILFLLSASGVVFKENYRLVGIVLLIILISGLCCMMGIDTPTRYETPQDS